MKEIYYNNNYHKNNVIFELNPLCEFIIETNDYKLNIKKDFFSFYIYKNICLIINVNGYQLFECDINKFTSEDIQKFPTLYMLDANIEYAFELQGEELFTKINNKYYFNIIFPVKDTDDNFYNKWIIGRIFFRKYPPIFSPLNRIVGFYLRENSSSIEYMGEREKDEIDEKENVDNKIITKHKKTYENNIILYIEIIGIALIFTCFGICIGKRIYYRRKNKVNELIDDYYQYNSDVEKNKENKEKNGKNTKNNYNSIEMSCKLGENDNNI
jgi:hypothetical protein